MLCYAENLYTIDPPSLGLQPRELKVDQEGKVDVDLAADYVAARADLLSGHHG